MIETLRTLSEPEAAPESFHDCHVHGLLWNQERFTFALSLQYILEWIPPAPGSSSFMLRIAEAQLTFSHVSDLKVAMEWSKAALDSQIASLEITKTRTTPTGVLQRYFEIEFAAPDGVIALWSTGYEVSLLSAPVTSSVTSIPRPK